MWLGKERAGGEGRHLPLSTPFLAGRPSSRLGWRPPLAPGSAPCVPPRFPRCPHAARPRAAAPGWSRAARLARPRHARRRRLAHQPRSGACPGASPGQHTRVSSHGRRLAASGRRGGAPSAAAGAAQLLVLARWRDALRRGERLEAASLRSGPSLGGAAGFPSRCQPARRRRQVLVVFCHCRATPPARRHGGDRPARPAHGGSRTPRPCPGCGPVRTRHGRPPHRALRLCQAGRRWPGIFRDQAQLYVGAAVQIRGGRRGARCGEVGGGQGRAAGRDCRRATSCTPCDPHSPTNSCAGDNMNISRQHARIAWNFEKGGWAGGIKTGHAPPSGHGPTLFTQTSPTRQAAGS